MHASIIAIVIVAIVGVAGFLVLGSTIYAMSRDDPNAGKKR